MFRAVMIAAIAALAVGATPPTAAVAAPATAYERADRQEARDGEIVRRAMDDFNARGAAGLAPHLRALEKVLGNLPERYPLIEERGELIISRANDGPASTLVALIGAAKDGKNVQVVQRENVYGNAAWLLAWAAVESRDPERALKILARALASQPHTPMLVAERGAALNLQHRWADAYANYDDALKSGVIMSKDQRALLLRGKGFALIELGRLDEAETTYYESLELDPGHGGALNELTYIGEQKAGKPRIAPEVFTSGEAREMGKDPE